ncbi:MAG: hypothetical protein FJX72_06435 [Armatimonadetes bacterium]|nr:hypothetical protein [Armatimonadota bacterium]
MPWCPKCRTEYEPLVGQCADCGVSLIADLPQEDMGKDPVIVAQVADSQEALVLVATLNAEGIPAYTAPPDAYLPQGGNPVATVTPEFLVWVPADAATAAHAVISAPPISDSELLAAEQATDPDPDVDEAIEPEP